MVDSLLWAEWMLLFSTFAMILVMVWSHFTNGTDHAFSGFTVLLTLALTCGYVVATMFTHALSGVGAKLNPAIHTSFEQCDYTDEKMDKVARQFSLPPICKVVSIRTVYE